MRKKGSALIFTILMLAFFMTITLTMFFMAKIRNDKSIYRLEGLKIDSVFESETSIKNYELYLAKEYVNKGHLYKDETNSNMSKYIGDRYVLPILSDGKVNYNKEIFIEDKPVVVPIVGKHYTGVVLNDFNEYFSCYWDSDIIDTLTITDPDSSITDTLRLSQPWISEEIIENGKIIKRIWLNNNRGKIVRLWDYDLGEKISIGGYRLIKLSGKDKFGNNLNLPLDIDKLDEDTPTEITLTYEKIISFNKGIIGEEGSEVYKITYVEVVYVTSNGISILIHSDTLKSMIVEKIE